MKSLVVFYSYGGNTRFIAEGIAGGIGADILELKPREDISAKPFAKLQGIKQVFTKESPKLEGYSLNPLDYDMIFIGTPVWGYTYVPALRSFFDGLSIKDKNIAFFCCSKGSKGKTFLNLRERLAGCNILGEIEFRDPISGDMHKSQEAVAWAKAVVEQALADKRE